MGPSGEGLAQASVRKGRAWGGIVIAPIGWRAGAARAGGRAEKHNRRGRNEKGFTFGTPAASKSITHGDRKSTRLNSSHANISYAVFCLKKKSPPSPLRIER